MNVYMLKIGTLDRSDNKFLFYDTDIFSSEKKALKEIEKRISLNTGYSEIREVVNQGRLDEYLEVTYSCMSVPWNGQGARECRVRYCLYKKELK